MTRLFNQLAALALALALSACGCSGCGDSANNHGYGWEYDAIGPAGMKVRKPGETARDVAVLEQRARNVFICADEPNAPPPPFVIFVPDGTLPDGFKGWFYDGPPLILLETADLIEHETLHYLLDRRGDLDAGHTSPLWARCFVSPTPL
jgi:hypothetical protein